MAISRERKQQQIAQLAEQLKRSKLTVIADYRGLSVAEIQQLRADLKAEDSALMVIKKTLISLGLGQVDHLEGLKDSQFEGPVALAFGFSDELAPAQILARFAAAHPQLQIMGAITEEGRLMPTEEVARLAALPARTQLQAHLVATLAAPLSGMARVLQANLTGLARIFNQLKQQQA